MLKEIKSRKKTSSNNYPYQNTDLADLPGEEWMDIPGLDGYFRVSSFGRVKRMEYQMQYRNGAICIKPEMIIKPRTPSSPNNYIGDNTKYLTTRVTVSGKRYNFSIARLVYHCFVAPIDMDDLSVLIVTRDADNFNIIPSNLMAVTVQQKQRRMIARNRFRSPLLNLSKEFLQAVRHAMNLKNCKQLTQYTLSGKKVYTYSNAAAAERETGICSSSIRFVANGGGFSAGGFLWRWGSAHSVDVKSLKTERRKKYREKNGIKITQYDLKGNRIAHYPSIKDASEATGVGATAIGLVIRNIYKSAKGYYWKKGYGKATIDLSGHKWGRVSMAATQSKKVDQYTLDGKYIRTFNNAKEAARFIGVGRTSISGTCIGKQKTSGGFKWRYAQKKLSRK